MSKIKYSSDSLDIFPWNHVGGSIWTVYISIVFPFRKMYKFQMTSSFDSWRKNFNDARSSQKNPQNFFSKMEKFWGQPKGTGLVNLGFNFPSKIFHEGWTNMSKFMTYSRKGNFRFISSNFFQFFSWYYTIAEVACCH